MAKPWRSKKLTDSARDMPCIRCGKVGETRACHFNGLRQVAYGKGRGQKCSDICVAFFCQDCDIDFSEGWSHLWMDKTERSEEFQHYVLMTLIKCAERGILKV